MKRRSRLEVIFDVLNILKGQGLPRTRVMTGARLNYEIALDIILTLIDKRLIDSEIRPRSFFGYERETEWYFLTPEGRGVIEDFEALKSRLS